MARLSTLIAYAAYAAWSRAAAEVLVSSSSPACYTGMSPGAPLERHSTGGNTGCGRYSDNITGITYYFGGHHKGHCEALKNSSRVTNLLCCDTDLCNKPVGSAGQSTSITSRTVCYTGMSPGAPLEKHSVAGETSCGRYHDKITGVTYYFARHKGECKTFQNRSRVTNSSHVTDVLCCDTDFCNKPVETTPWATTTTGATATSTTATSTTATSTTAAKRELLDCTIEPCERFPAYWHLVLLVVVPTLFLCLSCIVVRKSNACAPQPSDEEEGEESSPGGTPTTKCRPNRMILEVDEERRKKQTRGTQLEVQPLLDPKPPPKPPASEEQRKVSIPPMQVVPIQQTLVPIRQTLVIPSRPVSTFADRPPPMATSPLPCEPVAR